MRTNHIDLDKRLEGLSFWPFQIVGNNNFYSNLVLSSGWMREKVYREKKKIVWYNAKIGQQVAQCVQNFVLFTFLSLLMALNGGTLRLEKCTNSDDF